MTTKDTTETTATQATERWQVGKPPYAADGVAYILAEQEGKNWPREIAVLYGGDDSDRQREACLIACAPEYRAVVARAVGVLQRHAPPDGLSDHDAMSEFYEIFDGPEYRAVMAKAEGRS